MSAGNEFLELNRALTAQVLDALQSRQTAAVLAEAPPGAGKSTLTTSVARSLAKMDVSLRVPVVTQTNEQADDLVVTLARGNPKLRIARLTSSQGPSAAVTSQLSDTVTTTEDIRIAMASQVIVSTARKWQYVRAAMQKHRAGLQFEVALIDEAYQMRSDALLGVAGLFRQLFCVGDPGQLDPFTDVDDSVWKGLWYSPSRTAMGTLRAAHPELQPIRLPISWRLAPSAAELVAAAFYPTSPFTAGTRMAQRSMAFTARSRGGKLDERVDRALELSAEAGWAYLELPERLAMRTDREIAGMLASLVSRLRDRKPLVKDERNPDGRQLTLSDVALVTAHNDQVLAARKALSDAGVNPDDLTVSTANRIQGREYQVVFVWHPLAGRRDATAFHLEAGRMCVMLSRHRHACIVVGRAGAARLLSEFPDSDPIYLEEPERLPDGWEANFQVLEHLARHRV